MADAPVPESQAELLARLERLTPQQQSTFERLLAADGQACELNQQFVKSLQDRGLLDAPVDELTQGIRLCPQGCGHVWYVIPEEVQAAYAQWSAQWAEGEDIPAEAPVVTEAVETARRLTRRPARPMWWARIMNPLYGALELFGTRYDQGQLLTLPEDVTEQAAIVRLEYVQRATEDKAYLRAECGVCHQWFLNEHFRDKHGHLRHRDRFQADLDIAAGMVGPEGGAALRDTTGDAADRRQWVEYPPNLERSKASQMG